MSTTYPNLTSTNFPDAIDDFDSYVDPQIEEISLINQYYNFIEQNNLTSANQILIDNPSLIPKIVNAARLNQLRDGLIAVENYCRDNTPYYATCSTGASTTTARVATTTNGNFVLTTGAQVNVKFTYGNTASNAITLNVDNTGAKTIYRSGTSTTRYYWQAGEVITFVYDGTYWVMQGKSTASTTYYGVTKLETSSTSTSTSTALTPSSLHSFDFYIVSGLPVYSSSKTYAVGDKVRYMNSMYVCNTAITSGESWTSAHWTVLPTLQEQIDNKQDVLTFDATPTANSTNPVTSNGIYNALQDAGIGLAPTFEGTYGITTRQEIHTALTRKQCVTLTNIDIDKIEQGSSADENFCNAYLTYSNLEETVFRFTTIYNDTLYTFTIDQNNQWSYTAKTL